MLANYILYMHDSLYFAICDIYMTIIVRYKPVYKTIVTSFDRKQINENCRIINRQ